MSFFLSFFRLRVFSRGFLSMRRQRPPQAAAGATALPINSIRLGSCEGRVADLSFTVWRKGCQVSASRGLELVSNYLLMVSTVWEGFDPGISLCLFGVVVAVLGPRLILMLGLVLVPGVILMLGLVLVPGVSLMLGLVLVPGVILMLGLVLVPILILMFMEEVGAMNGVDTSWFCYMAMNGRRENEWLLWTPWWKMAKNKPLYQVIMKNVQAWDPGSYFDLEGSIKAYSAGSRVKKGTTYTMHGARLPQDAEDGPVNPSITKRLTEDMKVISVKEDKGFNPFLNQG